MSKRAEVIISMGCLLFTLSHALDIFLLISKAGAALEKVQIISTHIWTPEHSSHAQTNAPSSKLPPQPVRSHLDGWQMGFSEQGKHCREPEAVCLNNYEPLCVSALPLHSPEQDGVICAFYISMAEEAASRWLYLFQSHLFMQKETV